MGKFWDGLQGRGIHNKSSRSCLSDVLRGKSAATFYVKGNVDWLNSPLLSFSVLQPSAHELETAKAFFDGDSPTGLTLITGYGTAADVHLENCAAKRCESIICLFEGILQFISERIF